MLTSKIYDLLRLINWFKLSVINKNLASSKCKVLYSVYDKKAVLYQTKNTYRIIRVLVFVSLSLLTVNLMTIAILLRKFCHVISLPVVWYRNCRYKVNSCQTSHFSDTKSISNRLFHKKGDLQIKCIRRKCRSMNFSITYRIKEWLYKPQEFERSPSNLIFNERQFISWVTQILFAYCPFLGKYHFLSSCTLYLERYHLILARFSIISKVFFCDHCIREEAFDLSFWIRHMWQYLSFTGKNPWIFCLQVNQIETKENSSVFLEQRCWFLMNLFGLLWSVEKWKTGLFINLKF